MKKTYLREVFYCYNTHLDVIDCDIEEDKKYWKKNHPNAKVRYFKIVEEKEDES